MVYSVFQAISLQVIIAQSYIQSLSLTLCDILVVFHEVSHGISEIIVLDSKLPLIRSKQTCTWMRSAKSRHAVDLESSFSKVSCD